MRMKQIHRRILGGCLACLLCFTGSIPAFAAETATPANADERTEILPDLESEASETLDNGTPETPEAPYSALKMCYKAMPWILFSFWWQLGKKGEFIVKIRINS